MNVQGGGSRQVLGPVHTGDKVKRTFDIGSTFWRQKSPAFDKVDFGEFDFVASVYRLLVVSPCRRISL